MESKKWYLSKTMWVNLLMGIAMALSSFWPTGSQMIQQYFSEIGMGWGFVNIVLRLITSGKIELLS